MGREKKRDKCQQNQLKIQLEKMYDPAGLVKRTPETENTNKKKTKKNPPPSGPPPKKKTKIVSLGHFCNFLFFARIFGPHPGWGIFYFVIFSYFWVWGVLGVFTRPAGSEEKTVRSPF